MHEQKGEWAKSETLIWASMAIGMSTITEDNWPEFWARFDYYDRLVRINYSSVTATDVLRRVGLSTNADDRTESQFIKRLSTTLLQDARRDALNEEKAAKANDPMWSDAYAS
jgi:hypothetical protein